MFLSDFYLVIGFVRELYSRERIEREVEIKNEGERAIFDYFLDQVERGKFLNSDERKIYELGLKFKENHRKRKKGTIADHYLKKIEKRKEKRKKYSHKIKKYYQEIKDFYSLTSAWRFKRKLKSLGFRVDNIEKK